MKRDNKGRFLASDVQIWEASPYFESLSPSKMVYEMGFDPLKYKYVNSWLGVKGKGKRKKPRFYMAILKRGV